MYFLRMGNERACGDKVTTRGKDCLLSHLFLRIQRALQISQISGYHFLFYYLFSVKIHNEENVYANLLTDF